MESLWVYHELRSQNFKVPSWKTKSEKKQQKNNPHLRKPTWLRYESRSVLFDMGLIQSDTKTAPSDRDVLVLGMSPCSHHAAIICWLSVGVGSFRSEHPAHSRIMSAERWWNQSQTWTTRVSFPHNSRRWAVAGPHWDFVVFANLVSSILQIFRTLRTFRADESIWPTSERSVDDWRSSPGGDRVFGWVLSVAACWRDAGSNSQGENSLQPICHSSRGPRATFLRLSLPLRSPPTLSLNCAQSISVILPGNRSKEAKWVCCCFLGFFRVQQVTAFQWFPITWFSGKTLVRLIRVQLSSICQFISFKPVSGVFFGHLGAAQQATKF